MNKFLKTLFLTFSFLLVLTFFFKLGPKAQKHSLDLKSLEKCEDSDNAVILEAVKERLSSIKSLAATDIRISIGRLKVKGYLYYEENNLRLIINSFLGKEMDIGSNDKFFWFWSRRMKPQAIYYCPHDHVYNTNLRPIFNRDWIMDCFVLSRCQEYDGKSSFFKKGNLLFKNQLKKVSEDESVYLVTVIDTVGLNIVEKYICDLDYCVLACVEYSNFGSDHIPRSIKVDWYEENVYMNWEISNLKINFQIDESVWEIPNHGPMVDMTKRN